MGEDVNREHTPLLQMAAVDLGRWNFDKVPMMRRNYGFYMGDTLPFGEHFLRTVQAIIRDLFKQKIDDELCDIEDMVGSYLTGWAVEDVLQLHTNDRGQLQWTVILAEPSPFRPPVVEIGIMGIERWEELETYTSIEQQYIQQFVDDAAEYGEVADPADFDAWNYREPILEDYLNAHLGTHLLDIFNALVADMIRRTMMEIHI